MAVAGAVVVELYGNALTHGLQTSDATAPVFSAGPTANVVTASSVNVTATITDATPPVVFYAVAVADAASAPSSAQIQAGTDAADSAAPSDNDTITVSGQAASLSIGGLSSGTAYDVYYVAVDDSGNDTTPAKLDITTTSPAAATGTSPIAAITSINARRNRRRP